MDDVKTIETPIKKFKVEIKTYLTAEDEFEIKKVLYDAAEISGGTIQGMTGSKGDVMIGMEQKLMEKAVVKIDSEARDIWKRLLEMPSKDYDFIKKEVDKVREYDTVKKK
ncbi:unnamed protein product [marine sediment metagenome]|uniref:Uncharacterized protein n=1 Tax=marine sediment metagenome TaxID=412755 RepID=X0UTI3_9ZZZZ